MQKLDFFFHGENQVVIKNTQLWMLYVSLVGYDLSSTEDTIYEARI